MAGLPTRVSSPLRNDPDVWAYVTVEQLKAAQPFRSTFTLHLADGRELPVRYSEFAISSPSGRAMICQPDDATNLVDLLLVTDLEFKAVK